MALAFTLPDTHGTPTPLHVDGAPAAVVVFTCNHCPYALAWHERIQDVARDYADRGVRVLQINSNNAAKHPRDSLEAMKARVEAGEFASPYLHDETQEVALDDVLAGRPVANAETKPVGCSIKWK